MQNAKVMEDKLLDKVSGGVEIGNVSKDDNRREVNAEERENMWKLIKEDREWKFKDKEQEQKAKQMWIDAGLKLTQQVIDGITKLLGPKK